MQIYLLFLAWKCNSVKFFCTKTVPPLLKALNTTPHRNYLFLLPVAITIANTIE